MSDEETPPETPSATSPTLEEPSTPRRRRPRLRDLGGGASLYPLGILFGLNAVDELDQAAFSVLAPSIRDTFGLNLAGILALVTAITPVTLLIGIAVAHLADRSPRVRLAAIAATAWAVCSALTGLVVNVFLLGAARVGASIGRTVNTPTHNSLLSDYYPVSVRPTVFAIHGGANHVGRFLAPVTAGVLALYWGWRLPFLLFAIPTMILVLFAIRLPEPRRGMQDRLELGVTQEEAEQEETPAEFGEAWRQLYAIKTLRRIYIALPFWGVSTFGLPLLLSLFYADVYHLNEAERGLVTTLSEPFSILGLVVGAPIAQRLLKRNPALVMKFLAVTGSGTAIAIAVIAVSPNLAVAIGASCVQLTVTSVLVPGILAVLSIVIPPRVRSIGFVSFSLWFLPGLLVLPLIGAIGDTFGLRTGLVVLIPLYLTGSFILASSGKYIAEDIAAVRLGSMAEQEARKALAEGEPKLLLARGVDVRYDQVQVLFGVDFDLYPGEIVALLGTNGAGKSTFLKAISGAVDPSGGAIYFDGFDITHRNPAQTFQLGIIQMPGGKSVFPTLTVEEHLKLAGWMLKDDPEHVSAATKEVLEVFPRLVERWEQQAGNLSGGEQQMLGVAMALIARPKLFMIDELSLGLAPAIVEQLLEVVRRINAQGTSIIIVEQSVNVALTLAHRAYFMEKGEVRFSGPTEELLERGDILRAVFLQGAAAAMGTDTGASATVRRGRSAPASPADGEVVPPVLELDHLSKHFRGVVATNDVTFRLAPNEILGLIGPNGAGKTTLFDLVSGFLVPDEGTIRLGGVDVTRWTPDRRAKAGLGRSFQDARIFPSLTVTENLALGLDRHLDLHDPVAAFLRLPVVYELEEDIAWTVDDLVELMNLGAFRDKFVKELSTGSRRIVDLAMAIAHDPTVLMLDEPSSGIAQREAEALGPLLKRIQRETHCSILIIEHDMPLITGVADRMLALELGRVIAEGTPAEVTTDPQVVTSYLGGDMAAINRSGTGSTAKGARRTRAAKLAAR